MTAYGRAHITTESGPFLIEIHSVNRKSLDITINLPKELLFFDMDLRKHLTKEVRRGFITVRLTKEDSRMAADASMPDLEVMKSLHGSWKTYATELGYDPVESIPFYVLLNYGLSLNSAKELAVDGKLQQQLMGGFEKALSEFLAMREKEGASLLEDIHPRLAVIEKQLDTVIDRAQFAPEKLREKLEKRLEELELVQVEGEERIVRELVIFAEKVDVTEEITRLRSHVQQFRELLSSDKRRVGRELDFLIQEMNREVNTIAAKSQNLEITQAILGIKTEQEKIREQIQNIE